MAKEAHIEVLRRGVSAWNKWRAGNPSIEPDLSFFSARDVHDLDSADLHRVNLRGSSWSGVNLRQANLRQATLIDTSLNECNLDGADLRQTNLHNTDLSDSTLRAADLTSVRSMWVNLRRANLDGAHMADASLLFADMSEASLRGADLAGCGLEYARLINTDLSEAVLSGASVYGISAWSVRLDGAEQQNLVITEDDEPAITVDDIELAHFLYQILKNDKVRSVLDIIKSRAVLLLGRFIPRRKEVLNRIRDRLREEGYSPIVFDFAAPQDRDITETVTTLARMSRFIVADLTEPASIPKELEAIAVRVAIPIQPIIQGTERTYSMFKDYWKYPWVLELKRYRSLTALMANFVAIVTGPAEIKASELASRNNRGSKR